MRTNLCTRVPAALRGWRNGFSWPGQKEPSQPTRSGGNLRRLIWLAMSVSLLFLGACEEVRKAQQAAKPELDVKVTGGACSGFANYYFRLNIWHQHTGTIKNGKLTVTVSGSHLKGDKKEEVWSFDSWPPNKSETKTFDDFLLDTIGPDLKLTFTISVVSADTRPYSGTFIWSGTKWE